MKKHLLNFLYHLILAMEKEQFLIHSRLDQCLEKKFKEKEKKSPHDDPNAIL